MEIYIKESNARKYFPTAFVELDNENNIQCPSAKFICAIPYNNNEDGIVELTVMYYVLEKNAVLSALVCISDEDESAFIDEYFFVDDLE